ncbi:hypothetical protein Gpo141_00009599, partial [Globisporangium polare]
MKAFALFAGLAALAVSVFEVSANEHTYTLPDFPAGAALPAEASASKKFSLDAAAAVQATPTFQAKLAGIYMNGAPFTFKGANYFGMESGILVPHGLW